MKFLFMSFHETCATCLSLVHFPNVPNKTVYLSDLHVLKMNQVENQCIAMSQKFLYTFVYNKIVFFQSAKNLYLRIIYFDTDIFEIEFKVMQNIL